MLHEFLTTNRDELIRRCRSKVSKRNSPPVTASELEYGVPLFLEQLVEALYCDQAGSAPGRALISGPWKNTSGALESSRTATLHGAELFAKGYTVDQVVHGYGDICQSITELAKEKRAPITVDEFHTFNRLLDNAIADAVSSYGRHQAPPPPRSTSGSESARADGVSGGRAAQPGGNGAQGARGAQ